MSQLIIPCPHCGEEICEALYRKKIDIENVVRFVETKTNIEIVRDTDVDQVSELIIYRCLMCGEILFDNEPEMLKYIKALGNKREPDKDSL